MSLEGWKAVFEIGGVVLLALTFAFGAGALIVNSRLNVIQAREVADFRLKFEEEQQKTALAQKEAAEAKQIAGGFERDISTANQRAAEANVKAEGFRLDIAKANERAAAANETAEREKLARLQLEARLADRTLTPIQQNLLVADFRLSSSMVIDVATFGDTAEVSEISRLITESLRRAGWTVHSVAAMVGQATVKGILVGTRVGSDPAVAQASALLIRSLQAQNLSASPWAFEQMTWPGAFMGGGNVKYDAPIRMFIGSKP